MDPTQLVKIYETEITPFRDAFFSRDWALSLEDPKVDKKVIFRFFLEQTARGPAMTELVESWIFRAGVQCIELGLHERGEFLKNHSKEEANHHQFYIHDTDVLVSEWNQKYPEEKVDASELLSRPLNPGQKLYRDLHDQVAESATPYCQFAIENEIERLSVVLGPTILKRITDILGADVVKRLKFIPHHVLLDTKHSANNEVELGELLAEFPEAREILVQTGGESLVAFGTYLDECMIEARRIVN